MAAVFRNMSEYRRINHRVWLAVGEDSLWDTILATDQSFSSPGTSSHLGGLADLVIHVWNVLPEFEHLPPRQELAQTNDRERCEFHSS